MSRKILKITENKFWQRALILLSIVSVVLFQTTGVLAISQSALDAILNNHPFYVPGSCSVSSSSLTDSGATNSLSKDTYTLEQVKTFMTEPITSTWNISDSTVEQWFLKQFGAQATIAKYGLSSSNIGQITSAVKAAGVSPVFFYLYAVNEGGGAGGFINHYGKDVAGGGPANATRDAQYLVTQAQRTGGKVATGGGEPHDMPTAEAQQILDALPAGSIGIVYAQATSAVTAELEDLSGKTGSWTGKFGMPLTESMNNIVKMGGDPSQGGTSLDSCGGVAGEGIAKAVSWAKMIANNDGYGYDQNTRTTGWTKYQADPNCADQCGSFDCSSFIAAALTEAGYFTTNPNFSTANETSLLEQVGFTKIASSATSSDSLQPGDILISSKHTAMYVGDNQLVEALHNENHGINGGKVGDQTGGEITIDAFRNDNWNLGVWRASK